MGVPQVVIVGRPNVGKSSLFNWLVGKRLAIVDPTAGVTRDRLNYLICHFDRYFELVDTGGIGIDDADNLTQHIEDQINTAIESAAVILFVVDARDGTVPLDKEVAQRLRYVFYARWMPDPPRVDRTTRMTKLPPLMDALEGDAHRQFDAIWQYMQTLPEKK